MSDTPSTSPRGRHDTASVVRDVLVVSAVWLAYAGYIVGIISLLGAWGLVPALLPAFVAMVVVLR